MLFTFHMQQEYYTFLMKEEHCICSFLLVKHDTFYHCLTVTFYHVNGNFSEEIKQSNHFFRLLQYNFL